MVDRNIELGVMIPTFGGTATGSRLEKLSTVAEKLDYDFLWTGDHVTFPESLPNTYPFTPDNEPPPQINIQQDVLEFFQSLAYVAATTDDIKLGSNVCIAPYRHPVYLAKQALTIDALSDGRFEFGVGVGWLRTEFEVLDVPFEERGSRTDEFLRLFAEVQREGQIEFDGPHHSFQKTGFHPRPKDAIPIWIGGFSGAAFRRLAEFGDGWSVYWLTPQEVDDARERIMDAWQDYDREGNPEIAVVRPIHVGTDTSMDTDELLMGEPESIRNDVSRYSKAGVSRIVINLFGADLKKQEEQLHRFANEIVDRR